MENKHFWSIISTPGPRLPIKRWFFRHFGDFRNVKFCIFKMTYFEFKKLKVVRENKKRNRESVFTRGCRIAFYSFWNLKMSKIVPFESFYLLFFLVKNTKFREFRSYFSTCFQNDIALKTLLSIY